MKFTKKPITIEAVRWDGTPEGKAEIRAFVDADKPLGLDGNIIAVLTNHGLADCYPGDWVIRSPQGEYYPCTDAVMQATYDAVPEPRDIPPFEGTYADPAATAGFAGLMPIGEAMQDPDIHAKIMAAVAASEAAGSQPDSLPVHEDHLEEETTGEHTPATPLNVVTGDSFDRE